MHPVIKVENLTEVYADNTFKIFQFALRNGGSQILSNVNWDFVINGTIAFNSSQPMELKPYESAIVLAEYNFSTLEDYSIGVFARSS